VRTGIGPSQRESSGWLVEAACTPNLLLMLRQARWREFPKITDLGQLLRAPLGLHPTSGSAGGFILAQEWCATFHIICQPLIFGRRTLAVHPQPAAGNEVRQIKNPGKRIEDELGAPAPTHPQQIIPRNSSMERSNIGMRLLRSVLKSNLKPAKGGKPAKVKATIENTFLSCKFVTCGRWQL